MIRFFLFLLIFQITSCTSSDRSNQKDEIVDDHAVKFLNDSICTLHGRWYFSSDKDDTLYFDTVNSLLHIKNIFEYPFVVNGHEIEIFEIPTPDTSKGQYKFISCDSLGIQWQTGDHDIYFRNVYCPPP